MAQAHVIPNVLEAERAHEELLRIAFERAKLDRHEGHWLMVAYRTQANRLLGVASFAEYSERVLGHTPRVTEERLRVARALQELPELAHALETGSLHWTTVRELTRVATPETERQWLAAAQGRKVREVERMVSGLPRGAEPGDAKDAEAEQHALHFKVRSETLALFREAADRLRRETGEVLDDDALLLAIARRILGGPEDPGRANYQVAVTVCSSCGQGSIDAAGEAIPVSPDIVSMAACDAQHLDLRPHGAEVPRATQDIPPKVRRLVRRRDRCCVVPGCRNRDCDIHHLRPRAEGVDHGPTNLVLLCPPHHRALHEGRLVVHGDLTTRLRFQHADGSSYGGPASPRVTDLWARVFQALRGLGFRASDAREAIDRVRPIAGPDWSLQQCLRRTLQLFGEAASRCPHDG